MASLGRIVRVVAPRLILAVALVVVVVSVVQQWEELGRAVRDMGPLRVVVASVLGVLGVATTAEVWRCSVGAATGPVPRSLAYRVFWVSQAGKYVPGAVWPFVVQALAARRLGVEVRGVLTGGAVFLGLHAMTALLVGSVGVALIPETTALLRAGTWTATVVICAVLVSGAWRRLPRLLGSDALPRLDVASASRGVAWMCIAWLFYGGSTALLIAPLLDRDATPLLLSSTAASAIGWLVGLVVVVAPAGAGARELAMALVLGPLLGPGDVLAVVLLTRLAMVVGDLGLALTGVGALRELRTDRQGSPGTAAPPHIDETVQEGARRDAPRNAPAHRLPVTAERGAPGTPNRSG
jgi:hypothetical protein